jgi:secondary thiamine-phosphate synthase enzyme
MTKVMDFTVETKTHMEMPDITEQVREAVKRSGVTDGLCVVFIPHSTAGITITENTDAAVKHDFITKTSRIVPWDDSYQHLDGNSAAHIKTSMMGSTVTVPVQDGKLLLGDIQSIFLCEFDGPRPRTVLVKMMEG